MFPPNQYCSILSKAQYCLIRNAQGLKDVDLSLNFLDLVVRFVKNAVAGNSKTCWCYGSNLSLTERILCPMLLVCS